MDQVRKQTWVSGNSEWRLPGSGVLEDRDGDAVLGALGFRGGGEECSIWYAGGGEDADWVGLVRRVTAQARKAKYVSAVFDAGPNVPEILIRALEGEGFTGSVLARKLVCEAADELQPYLDWKGRVTQLAHGKGSEAINEQLFAIVAVAIPAEVAFKEVEINAILKELHLYGDHSGLRRELVDRGYLERDRECTAYRRGPRGEASSG